MNSRTFLLPCALAAALALAPAHAVEPVRIGFIDVLSGPFALTGQSSLQQLREVVIQLNASAKPGEPPFEIVPFDGKGSSQDSASALKAATDRGVRYITQGGGSGVAFALVGALNKLAEREPDKAMLYLNYAAMDPALTNEQCSFWHFRFYPTSEMHMDALSTYLIGQKEVKKVYLLNQNYAHGQQVSKSARAYLARKRPDIEIVGDDLVPLAQTRDFAPYVAKIRASGADTVITANWGSDLTLLLKSAREAGLDTRFYTMNANNPGTPTQLGPYGAGKVHVMWNWSENGASADLEKIAVAYRKKYNEDFIFASHWNTMNMLREAMRKARSTDPVRVGYALEGMKYASPVGDIEMRKADHQLMGPLYLGVWAKQDGVKVKRDSEGTGYGFRAEAIWPAATMMQPTTCNMVRPAAPA